MQLPLLLATAALLSGAPSDTTAAGLVQAMHDRYAGSWPDRVTFVQQSTFFEPDGKTRVETWYEAIEGADKLRIDFAPIEGGNGIIFRSDSVYQFKADSLLLTAHQPHALMVLSRSVYSLPVEESVAKLRELGFDLSKMREDTWQERPVYVVGADAGDLRSAQFWIDKEHLYFVRLLQPVKQKPELTQEIQFNRYQRLGGGWIETEVVFMVDGQRRMLEEYSDIRHDVVLDAELFDPGTWAAPGWVER
jgi:hypothetical protein